MKLQLVRITFNATETLGHLYIDGNYFCDTLEDTFREVKIKHETCIPTGKYKVTLTYSNRFKRVLPLLHNVPNFEGIRIHRGNTDKDTSGCILVGEKSGNKVIFSTKYEEQIVQLMQGKDNIEIEII